MQNDGYNQGRHFFQFYFPFSFNQEGSQMNWNIVFLLIFFPAFFFFFQMCSCCVHCNYSYLGNFQRNIYDIISLELLKIQHIEVNGSHTQLTDISNIFKNTKVYFVNFNILKLAFQNMKTFVSRQFHMEM